MCSLAATYFCTPLVFPPHLDWFPLSLFIPSAAASCFLNNLPEAMSPTPYSASLVLFSTPTLLYLHSQDFTIAQLALVFLFYPSAWFTPLSSLHLLQLGDTLHIGLFNPSVHTFWMSLPDSADSVSYRDPHSLHPIPSHPTPYSHTEATLTIAITFCLLLSNISALFPSEELPVSQLLLIWLLWFQLTFFPSSQFLTLILRKLPSFMLMSLVALCRPVCLLALAHSFPLHLSLSVLLPERAILLTWSAERIAFPLISVIPSFLSDLFPCLTCPFSYPLTCSFHHFHLNRFRISHLISAHFLLFYLSFIAQIDYRLALFLTLHSYLMNYEVWLPST